MQLYQFKIFGDNPLAFTTTKALGSMSAPTDTDEERTKANQNRANLAKTLGIPPKNLILSKQIHGNKVAIVDKKTVAAHKYHLSGQGIPDVDALVTTLPGVCIAIRTSDCVPIVLYEPKNQIIAVAHSGWPGTVKKIAIEVVKTMETLGAKPQNILAGIGPSIGPCHFEISNNPENDVICKVKKAFSLPKLGSLGQHPLYETLLSNWHKEKDKETGQIVIKAHFDLWQANKELLIQAGLKPTNIEVSQLCTVCHQDEFYSWRATHSGQSILTGILLPS